MDKKTVLYEYCHALSNYLIVVSDFNIKSINGIKQDVAILKL